MLRGKFPLAALVAIAGALLAVTVAMTSSRDHPPRYHKVIENETNRDIQSVRAIASLFRIIKPLFHSSKNSLANSQQVLASNQNNIFFGKK